LAKLIKIILVCNIILSAVLSLLFVAAIGFLHTEVAGMFLQTKINDNIPGTLQWKKYKLSVFSGSLIMENVSLKDQAGEDVVFLPYLSLKISWWDIPRGILMFDSIILDDPKVYLSEDETGRLNLVSSLSDEGLSEEGVSDEKPPSGPGLPFNIMIQKAVIRRGGFQYHAGPDSRILLPKIDMEINQGNLWRRKVSLSGKLFNGEVSFDEFRTLFTDLSVKATLTRDRLSGIGMNLTTKAGSNIKVSGRILDIFHRFQPELDVEINGEMDDILGSFSLYDKASGILSGKASIKGSLDNPGIRLVAGYRNADVSGTQFDLAEIACSLDNGKVVIESASLHSPVGVLKVTGDVDLQKVLPNGFLSENADGDATAYRLSGSLISTETDMQASFLKGVTGSARSVFTIEGKGLSAAARSGRISQKLLIRDMRKDGVFRISDASLSSIIEYEKEQIDILELALQIGGENSLSGVGRVDLTSGSMEGEVSSTIHWPMKELSISSVENLNGNLNLTASISGTLEEIMIKGFFQANDLAYQDYCLESVITDFTFSGEKIYFDSVRIQNRQSMLSLSGVLRLFDSNRLETAPHMDFSIHGDEILLEDFLPELTGVLRIKGSVFGEVTHPEGNVEITGESFNIYGQKVKSADLKVHADKEKLYIDQNTIVISEDEEIQMDGWVSFYQEQYDFRVFSKGISLNHLENVSRLDWGPAKLYFSISGEGNFENPKCSGEVGVTSLELSGNQFDPFETDIRFSDWTIEVYEKRNKALSAEVDLKSKEVNAQVRLKQIQLAPWLKLAGMDDLSGQMGLDLQITGQYPELENIFMHAVFSDLKIFWDQNELLYADNLFLEMEKGKFNIPKSRLFFSEDGFLDLVGNADLSGPIDVKCAGQVPAKMIEIFTEEITGVKGLLQVTASIDGMLEKPLIQSSVEIRKVQGKLPYISEDLREMNGTINITPEMISLKEIHGLFGSGRASLNGTIGLRNYPDLTANLQLSSHALPVEIPDLNLLLNTDITLKMDQDEKLLSGEVVILEGLYSRNVDLNPIRIVTGRSRAEELVMEPTEPSLINRIALDIDVKNRNPFVVDNNISLLQLKPNFHIRGDINRPVFTGRAEVESGMIFYQRKEFDVTRGVVDFINPYQIEPRIELEGKTQIREWTIFLEIAGVPENLKITLRSEPDLQDGDILSLLVFGKTVQEFIEGEGGQSSSPEELLASLITERLQKDVKEATGLDSVQVGYQSIETESDSSRVNVELGKDLSPQITVKYAVETVKGKAVQRAITEYRFLENVMLEAYQNSEGDYGGELQYRLEFR